MRKYSGIDRPERSVDVGLAYTKSTVSCTFTRKAWKLDCYYIGHRYDDKLTKKDMFQIFSSHVAF